MLNNAGRITTEDTATAPIRLMVLDDHEMVRKGLRAVLENYRSKYLVVAEASTLEQALADANHADPQVALVDLGFHRQEYEGFDVIKTLLASHPQLLCIVYTGIEAEAQLLKRAKGSGAKGWVCKHELAGSLLLAIDTVVLGDHEYWPAVKAAYFTKREEDVLGCLAEGMNNREIADRLLTNAGTPMTVANVEHYVGVLYQKAFIAPGDRGKLVKYAIKGGWKAPK